MSFDSLGLSAELLRAIAEQGYSQATPVQSKAIPIVLSGKDVLAGAQTGTGKTAGFTLPVLQLLSARTPPAKGKGRRPVRALVLTPTRELAAQVGESVETYGRYLSLRSSVIFGGVKINPQIARLREGVDILVATPGRLLDHAGQKTVDLSRVEILVLDEADRMLDMGFIHDIRKVMALLPDTEARQTLLFSATFSAEIKALANRLLNQPELIEVARQNTAAERIEQVVYPVDKSRKRELLSWLIGSNNWQQVLVFTRTKHGANRLAKQLEQDGLTAAAIHGNKSQGARTRALAGFKSGDVRVLVATDIAARGLDIDQLPHVVNYELPNVPEDYVHRIGRTGRAGREGEAMSLVCVDELKLLRDIERLLDAKISRCVLEGYEPDPDIKPEPIQNGRQRRQQGGRGRNGVSHAPARGRQGNGGRGRAGQQERQEETSRQGGARTRGRGRVHQGEDRAGAARSEAGAGSEAVRGNGRDADALNQRRGAGQGRGGRSAGRSANKQDADARRRQEHRDHGSERYAGERHPGGRVEGGQEIEVRSPRLGKGLGKRLVVDGNTLTASNTNGYVMQETETETILGGWGDEARKPSRGQTRRSGQARSWSRGGGPAGRNGGGNRKPARGAGSGRPGRGGAKAGGKPRSHAGGANGNRAGRSQGGNHGGSGRGQSREVNGNVL